MCLWWNKMNEGFELLNGLFYWLPDELNLETKIEKEEEWERSSIWWEELGDMGGQVGVTVWRGVKVQGIKTTVYCKIYCEAWIYAQVSIEGEQETVTEPVGFSLGWECGRTGTRKEKRAEEETINTTRPTGSCQALHPSLPEHFLWDSARCTRGLLLSSAPPEDEGHTWIHTGSHSWREELQAVQAPVEDTESDGG